MRSNGCFVVVLVLLVAARADSGVVVEESPDRTGHQVLRIKAANNEEVDKVTNIAKRHEIDEWVELNKPNNYIDVMVNVAKRHHFKRDLQQEELVSMVMIEDVEEVIRRHASRSAEEEAYDYLKFNTFEKIEIELKRIADKNPNKAIIQVIGTTYEKRNIYVLRVSADITDTPTKPIVLIDAGIHAREWVSVSTIMYLINQLVTNPQDSSQIRDFLESYDFVFMPVLNPDGYVYTWSNDRLWRKNRAPNKGSHCIGVDLNRNWDYMWGGEGTSDKPCHQDFRGYKAFSELETIAAKQYVETYKDKVVLYINFHAYGQLWMTPYGFSTTKPSNEEEMMHYSRIACEAIKGVRGTTYDYGPVYTTIYPASSISVDWVRGAEGIRIAYTVELPDKGLHGFITPETEIGPIGAETWKGIEQLLKHLGNDKNLLMTSKIV